MTQNNLISETKYWEIYLNPDQYYLGRCVIFAKREVPSMSELTKEEWMDFVELVKIIEIGFKERLGATMFNWTCLMNHAYRDKSPRPHVHWHMRPRYRKQVEFAGLKFIDKEFGEHYARETEKSVSEEVFQEIIRTIKEFIN